MLILEANFPFAEKVEYKKRPVLALTEPIGKYKTIICAFISSKIPSQILETDLILDLQDDEFLKTGLIYTSIVRLHKLTSLETYPNISGIIGELPKTKQLEIKQRLNKMFNL